MIVQRKLQVKYGKQTPNIDSIKVIFQRLYKTNRITNRHCFKKPLKSTEKKIGKVYVVFFDELLRHSM